MDLLFVVDPLASFKTYKDTTFAMMREAARRELVLWACEVPQLVWQRGGRVTAMQAQQIALTGDPNDWYRVQQTRDLALAETQAVLMRKDPPFDSEYFYATHLLQQAEREGARVFNKPAALRDHPEKLSILEFPQYSGPTIVTRDAAAIIETLNRDGAVSVMVQKYLPEITQGDKRILVIGGEPVPFSLARIPQGSEIRGNLAAGGKGVAQPLSARDREIAAALGPTLAARGLLLVGLDVIGDCLTEINVTSPTCFQEISEQTGFDVPRMFLDALEKALA